MKKGMLSSFEKEILERERERESLISSLVFIENPKRES